MCRALKSEGWGRPPFYTSNSYSGTVASLRARGFVLEPLPNAVYCVPFQPARECDGVAKYLTHLLGDTKILTPPRKGPAPRVKTRLSDSLVGYGFLTTAQYIADLFFAVADVPGVSNASFPAMLCYSSDPDYWLGALLLAALQTYRSMCLPRPWWPFSLVVHISCPRALQPNMRWTPRDSPKSTDRYRRRP